VRKAIQRLADVTPESEERLRAELEQALTGQRERLGSHHERLQDDAAEALLEAQQRVQEILEERAAEQKEAERMEVLIKDVTDQVTRAEAEAEQVIAESKAATEGVDQPPDEALKSTQAAQDAQEAAKPGLRSSEVAIGKCLRELEAAAPSKAFRTEAQSQLAKLEARVTAALEKIDLVAGPLKAARERASRRALAAKREREQRELFDSHDKDGDHLLCRKEVAAFAEGEYELAGVREEFLDRIVTVLGSSSEDGAGGVPYDRFPRLRQMLAIERSEVRARLRRAEEEERQRREREEAERRQREIAERTEAARSLLVACGRMVPEVTAGMPAAEKVAAPLLAEEKLDSAGLRIAADAAEEALREPMAALARARAKLQEANQVLGSDLAHMLAPEVDELDARLGRERARVERLRKALGTARSRASRKEVEEERARKQRKAFAKLERAYEELDDGDTDDEDWS